MWPRIKRPRWSRESSGIPHMALQALPSCVQKTSWPTVIGKIPERMSHKSTDSRFVYQGQSNDKASYELSIDKDSPAGNIRRRISSMFTMLLNRVACLLSLGQNPLRCNSGNQFLGEKRLHATCCNPSHFALSCSIIIESLLNDLNIIQSWSDFWPEAPTIHSK